ncbi:MAG: putative repeat protein [Conexibacter sp.]|nr:putative repeat protein [Conexibacter sp.]
MVTLGDSRYELLETLGAGGEARVVKALDRRHDRLVALKIRPVADERSRAGLLAEARVLLAIPPHRALPLVREDFFEGGEYIIAMDWVDGIDLAVLVRDEGQPGLAVSSVLAYLAEAAQALTHLHAQTPPIYHGDVKPANLILAKGGTVKLVDFGLSSAREVPGALTGTPGFRAPELAAGQRPTRASDIYALAATAFALLSGEAPAGELPSWEGIDPDQARQLEAAIRLGMATDPSRRPTTAGELIERLRTGWEAGLPSGVVTFCLSQIDGAAALWDRHPQAMATTLVRHDELIAAAVSAHHGSVVTTTGDGDSTVSVFASATDAAAAALAASRALAVEAWPQELRIAARWGLHTGEIERRGTEYRGSTIVTAGSLRAQADGGQIFLSRVTAELVAAHLPVGCELVDLGDYRLDGQAAPQRISAITAPGLTAPLPTTDCPYRGLRAFQPEDRGVFFGRDEVVADLLGRLSPGHLLAVVGASGSGKSSILRAGIVAAVEAGEISGLRSVSLLTPGVEPSLDVPDEPDRLVVVDQFEELFTLCDDAVRRDAFVDALLRLRCAVAIGVRADHYGQLSAHPALARAVASRHMLLGAMAPDELERVVTEPARLSGLRIEHGLVDLILRDVASEPGALPLLSHALRATWTQRDGRTLTVDGYRATGGVASAIARTADAVFAELSAPQQELARGVFLRMTDVGDGVPDARRRVAVEDLVTDAADRAAVTDVLVRLADARLVTLDEHTVEVAHEALIREWPRLRRWLDEDRVGLQLQRRLGDAARLWAAGGREASDLYRGARLAAVSEVVRHLDLNATERDYLAASVAAASRARQAEVRGNRRLRALLGTSVVLLVAAIVGGGVSLTQRNHARDAKATAQSQALQADAGRVGALALNAPALDESLLDALAAVRLQDRPETRGDLLAVFQRNVAAVRTFPVSEGNIAAFAISPDGRRLAVGDGVGVVRFVDLRTFRVTGAPVNLPLPVLQWSIAFSPDGRTLAVGAGQAFGAAKLFLIDVARRRARTAAVSLIGPPTLAYAPDGRLAIADSAEADNGQLRQRLLLLDGADGRPQWMRSYPVRPGQQEAHVLFTPSGELITSASQGQTLVWDARRGRVLRRFAIGGRIALSPRGVTVAVAIDSPSPADPTGAVGLIDLRTGHVRTLESRLSDEWILWLAFTPDGRQLVGPTFNSTSVWDLASGRITQTFPGLQRSGTNPGVLIDPRGVAFVIAGGGAINAWDPTGRLRVAPQIATAALYPSFSYDGKRFATLEEDGSFAVFDSAHLRRERLLPARDETAGLEPSVDSGTSGEAAFLPDGRLATGGSAGTVSIRDVATGAVTQQLTYPGPIWAVAAGPDGKRLAVQWEAPGGHDSHVEVRALPSGRTLYTRTVRFGPGIVFFARGGRALISSGCCNGGSTVVSWNAASGARRFTSTLAEPITSVSIPADRRSMLVGTQGGHVLLLSTRTGRQLGPLTKVSATPAQAVALAPDGKSFVVGARDGTTTLWDTRTRTRLGDQFPVAPGIIPEVTFMPDGRLLVGDEAETSSVWPLGLPTLRRFACRVAGRTLTRAEWAALLPGRRYERVCP